MIFPLNSNTADPASKCKNETNHEESTYRRSLLRTANPTKLEGKGSQQDARRIQFKTELEKQEKQPEDSKPRTNWGH